MDSDKDLPLNTTIALSAECYADETRDCPILLTYTQAYKIKVSELFLTFLAKILVFIYLYKNNNQGCNICASILCCFKRIKLIYSCNLRHDQHVFENSLIGNLTPYGAQVWIDASQPYRLISIGAIVKSQYFPTKFIISVYIVKTQNYANLREDL